MRAVYEAENIIDANLVKGLLEAAGIPAYVRGAYLTGGIGELPVSGLLAVCVPAAALAEAGQVLADWQALRPLARTDDDPATGTCTQEPA